MRIYDKCMQISKAKEEYGTTKIANYLKDQPKMVYNKTKLGHK
jgi:hypothetical protein